MRSLSTTFNKVLLPKISTSGTCGKAYVSCADLLYKGGSSDLKQLGLKDVGEFYCGPVSAANAIITMAKNGFPQLMAKDTPDGLIHTLASFFKTDSSGTVTNNLCRGIDEFISSRGLTSEIKYQGFRQVDSKYKLANIADLSWIKDRLKDRDAVLLNLGIYKKKPNEDVYARQYGHFVFARGFGHDGLSPNPNYLTIRDPHNEFFGDQYINLSKLRSGTLVHNKDDNEIALTSNAVGFLKVGQRFNFFEPDEFSIVNSAISLKVHKK